MEMNFSDFKELTRELIRLDYIKPEDIPEIELYMDQVTTFMDNGLAKTKRSEDDKTLTKTMINNYTKNNILPPPNKKKYSKDHMILLIFIYYLKNFLSISDIQSLLAPVIEKFYNAPADAETSLSSIYQDIFDLQTQEFGHIQKSMYSAYRMAESKFDSKEESYLHLLAYISILSYDIYAKKQVIESIIDNLKREAEEKELSEGKSKDKKKKS